MNQIHSSSFRLIHRINRKSAGLMTPDAFRISQERAVPPTSCGIFAVSFLPYASEFVKRKCIKTRILCILQGNSTYIIVNPHTTAAPLSVVNFRWRPNTAGDKTGVIVYNGDEYIACIGGTKLQAWRFAILLRETYRQLAKANAVLPGIFLPMRR